MQALPEGTVTVLFSDIEGSTGLVSRLGPQWGPALSAQRAHLRAAFAAHGGHEMGTEGDSFFVVFDAAHDAVLAAVDGQRAMQAHAWPAGAEVRVRVGLHTGEPQRHEEGYIGLDVHRGARIAGTAHGGQVVLSEATHQLVDDLFRSDSGIVARDLGWHRLKDLTAPEHLYDLAVDELLSTFPPLRSLGTEASLPRPVTALVGRDDEVSRLHDLLSRDHVRLATVTGPGGTGKTRVALAAAFRLAAAQAGVFFVLLSGANDSDAAWSGIADAVGAGGSASVAARERVLHVLAGRPVLLVLDNLEQIADIDVVLAELLAACPQLRVLATSRRPLHLAAEHEFALAPMGLPPAAADLAAARDADAVQLFCSRAQMVRPGFALTADNVGDVVAVCRRLDGLPLAIELAAARLRMLSPRGLLGRLDDGLGAVPSGGADRPERQRTLHSTIAWSHDLLAPADRLVFRRLGAFVGAAGIDAVEQVTGLGDVDPLDSADRLADASLVRVRDLPDGEPGLAMLQTVRSFAREQLTASPECDDVLDRHVTWCADLADSLVDQLRGPAPLDAIDTIDALLPDIRAALGRATEPGHPERHEAAARIMAAMSGYWYRYRFATEWRTWHERLRAATAGVDSVALVQSLHGTALALLQEGAVDSAIEALEQAVSVARRLGDRALEARGLNSLGVALLEAGDRRASRARLEESLALARDLGQADREATVLSNLAVLHLEEGDDETGLDCSLRALAIDRASGDLWSVTLNQINMTPALARLQGPSAAHAHLRGLADHVADVADDDLTADLMDQYVYVLVLGGDHRRAARLAGAAQAYRAAHSVQRHAVETRLMAGAHARGREALGSAEWEAEMVAGQGLDEQAALLFAAGSELDPAGGRAAEQA